MKLLRLLPWMGMLLLAPLLEGVATAAPTPPVLPDAQGWNCTTDAFPGYYRTGSAADASLAGDWSLSYATWPGTSGPGFGEVKLQIIAEIQGSDGHYLEMDTDVEKYNGVYYVHHRLDWNVANSSGYYLGVVRSGTPDSGSSNLVRAADGTFSAYLDGTLAISNLSFGTNRPDFAQYGFYNWTSNPCVDMDGTFSNTSNLSSWTQQSAQYFVTQLLSNTSFRVYTLPF